MVKNWKKLFRPRILERGYDYYLNNRVSDLREEDYGYSATVEGSDTYSVTIYTRNNEVTDMECDCPHAQDGNNCKHMAAVLFEINDQEETVAGEEENRENIYDILDRLDEEELREELTNIIRHNPEYAERIFNRYRQNKITDRDIERIAFNLQSIAYDYSSDGVIDWRNGFDYVREFQQALRDTIDPMIIRDENLQAFEVLKEALRLLNEVEMDGSSGEHSMIADTITEYFERVVDNAEDDERVIMHQWFREMHYGGSGYDINDPVDYVYENSFNDEKYITGLLQETRENIERYLDESDYYLVHFLELYRDILIRSGRSLDEYEKWMNEHDDRSAVQEIRLREYSEKNNTEKRIEYLEKLTASERFPHVKRLYLNELLKEYRKNGNVQKEKEVLKKLIFTVKTDILQNAFRLKGLSDEEEWAETRNRIIKEIPYVAADIYTEEKMYDKLFETVIDYTAEQFEKYSDILIPYYPEKIKSKYLNYLQELVKRHGGAITYREMKKYLIKLCDIKDGKKEVTRIIRIWQDRYAARKAMQKMLDEVLEYCEEQ